MKNITVDISLPKSFDELTQEQLRFLYLTIVKVQVSHEDDKYFSLSHYAKATALEVAALCLLKWADMEIIAPHMGGFLVSVKGERQAHIEADHLNDAAASLLWVTEAPDTPVRLEWIAGRKTQFAPDLENLPFEKFIACDNLSQIYMDSPSDDIICAMAQILYDDENISPLPHEGLSVIYWWAAAKNLLAEFFPHFFRPSPEHYTPNKLQLTRDNNAVIRALTKGDITKESEILSAFSWRALAELDALAFEAEQIDKAYKK